MYADWWAIQKYCSKYIKKKEQCIRLRDMCLDKSYGLVDEGDVEMLDDIIEKYHQDYLKKEYRQ